METMNRKALVMLSGGLDSTLAAKLMLEQGIELVGVNFVSIFCTCTSRKKREAGCISEALEVGKKLGIQVKTYPKGMDYFKIVENPKYGYGKGINPCIDCRIYMLKKAKALMPEFGASFIVTGEVLGQRPMSQHRHQMKIIEKESGLEGLILRPLSAHLLPETIPEKLGMVDRGKLLNISGRSRKRQIELAKIAGLNDFPCPSGGCLLTDRIFSKRLKDLFEYKKNYTINDLKLLKVGRHFRISPELKIIIGRNKAENEILDNFSYNYPLYKPLDVPGPSIIIDGTINPDTENIIHALLFRYSDVNGNNQLRALFKKGENTKEIFINRTLNPWIERTMIKE
jgi:tRNA U34 2-thiouridine synthase MnmA/TrmU